VDTILYLSLYYLMNGLVQLPNPIIISHQCFCCIDVAFKMDIVIIIYQMLISVDLTLIPLFLVMKKDLRKIEFN